MRSANIELKFHIEVAKWPYINEIRTISYKVKYLLKHVLCLRIFRTALVPLIETTCINFCATVCDLGTIGPLVRIFHTGWLPKESK